MGVQFPGKKVLRNTLMAPYLYKAFTFSIMFIPHCKYFFLSSCTLNMAHNAVNTRPQSLLHRKCPCTRPVRQMPFGVTSLKIQAFSVSSERHCCQSGVNGIAKVPKRSCRCGIRTQDHPSPVQRAIHSAIVADFCPRLRYAIDAAMTI